MGHFGIGTAVQAAVSVVMQTSRGSGRTTSLVESVKEGDRIVFADSREADRVRRLCLEHGVTVECIVVGPDEPQEVLLKGTSQGRMIFDHTWIERFYTLTVERAQAEIDKLEQACSGYGAPHRETRRRAEELSKWYTFLRD